MSLQLKPVDRISPCWQKIVLHCEERIVELQGKIAGDMAEEETWKYRGRIAELRAIIAADKDAPEIHGEQM
jgi:hypothetical protein